MILITTYGNSSLKTTTRCSTSPINSNVPNLSPSGRSQHQLYGVWVAQPSSCNFKHQLNGTCAEVTPQFYPHGPTLYVCRGGFCPLSRVHLGVAGIQLFIFYKIKKIQSG
jgi:hypothetical protein